MEFLSEQSIACVRGSVLVYDDSSKKWIPSGSSGTQGLSKIQIFHNLQTNGFRIVGRKEKDHEVVVNCSIFRGLNYNQTTQIFHQWRDKRQIYGLNFMAPDDASTFAQAMTRALEVTTANNSQTATATSSSCSTEQSSGHSNNSSSSNQSRSMMNGHSAPTDTTTCRSVTNGSASFSNANPVHYHETSHYLASNLVFCDEKSLSSSNTDTSAIHQYQQQKIYATNAGGVEQYGREEICYAPGIVAAASSGCHQRRSSQGSSGSSGSAGLYNNVIYSTSSVSSAIQYGSTPPSVQQQYVHNNNGSNHGGPSLPSTTPPQRQIPKAPPPPPQPKTPGGVPAPPPLPSNILNGSPSTCEQINSLAQALASTKLRKTSSKQIGENSSKASLNGRENRSQSMGSVENCKKLAKFKTNFNSSFLLNGPSFCPAMRLSTSSQQQPQPLQQGTPHSNIISEMAATLARRRMMMQESANEGSSSPGTADSPTKFGADRETKKIWENRNGSRVNDDKCLDSPRTHRKVPSGSSLSSQEDVINSGSVGLSVAPNGQSRSHGGSSASLVNFGVAPPTSVIGSTNGHSTQRSLSNGPSTGALFCVTANANTSIATAAPVQRNISAAGCSEEKILNLYMQKMKDLLDETKKEILQEVKQEMQQAKKEILDAAQNKILRHLLLLLA
uniref:WH1 domain-containing protein n=1 Tax=Romanomermis culicivorax TaxID=13658 RepID=A0A915L0Y6_ROMCU